MKKKIILYNTHLTGLINYGEVQIRKMRQVFDYFAGRQDVVLWWRPHPLSRETLASMNNGMLEAYDQLVQEYKKRAIGIYDEDMDVHRAITMADAYYGDTSSLVAMFGVTGKPMLRQDVGCNFAVEQSIPLGFGDCVVSGDKMYVSSAFFCGLFCCDPDSGNMEYIAELPQSYFYRLSYHLLAEEEGRLIFGPFREPYILEYSLVERKFEKYSIPERCGLEPMYFKSVRYGEYLFMISHTAGQILKYHLKTHEVCVYDGWYEKLLRDRNRVHPYIFMGEAVVKEDSFFMASSAVNAVLEFHMKDGTSTTYSVGKPEEAFSNIVYDGQQFWLATLKGDIYRWDGRKHSEKLIGSPYGFRVNNYPAFWKMIYAQNHVYIFPGLSNMILRIDCKNSTMECFYELEQKKKSGDYEEKYANYQCVSLMDCGKILAYSYYEDCMQIIDPSEDTVTSINLSLSDSEKKAILGHNPFSYPHTELQNEDNVYLEGWPVTLPAFLDYVVCGDAKVSERQKELYKSRFSNMDGTCGEKSWLAVKTLLVKSVDI